MRQAASLDPCQACGACCATFRVSFDSSERDDRGGCVPATLCEDETATTSRLRGTDHAPPRCAALVGQVGGAVRCAIYAERPVPCRDFAPHGVAGVCNSACNDARRRHGLPPLPDPYRP